MDGKKEEKGSQLFRKKSLDRISSPEELNDYIRVANPGVWLVLIGIVVLLGGMFAWAMFGKLDTTVNAVCVTEDERTTCYVSEDHIGKLKKGMKVILSDGTECSIQGFAHEAVTAENALSEYNLYVSGFAAEDWLHPMKLDRTLLDGVEQVKIVVDSVSPISFIVS